MMALLEKIFSLIIPRSPVLAYPIRHPAEVFVVSCLCVRSEKPIVI